jgi:hypothetical protein
VASWRDEITEAAKTKAEREREEQERQRARVQEALGTARAAFDLASQALEFARDRLTGKANDVALAGEGTSRSLTLCGHALGVELSVDTAVLKVALGEAKPREFDFAKDRHIAPADVEEYVGRRALELVRAAQKSHPW